MDSDIFPRRDFQVDPTLVFVVMPFSNTFDALYETLENLISNHCHLRCLRADDVFDSGRITGDIWRCVNEAMLIVADLSDKNANVFYEVGLAHALGKPVVLLTRNIDDVPFDLRALRVLQYDPETGFNPLRQKLLKAIYSNVSTLPERWDRPRQSIKNGDPLVRITNLHRPTTVGAGQPFEITVRARNVGGPAREGYVSVSFPEGVEDHDVSILQTDVETQVGTSRRPWCGGRIILSYPIAEASSTPWEADTEHFLKVQVRSQRRGWLHYYVSASGRTADEQWIFDPGESTPHIDQRGEHVLCGIVEVV